MTKLTLVVAALFLLVPESALATRTLPLPPLSSFPSSPGSETQSNPTRRVNAPYFDGAMRYSEMAIFWFGRVTPATNSVDVRVGYRQEYLEIYLSVIDRRLWYDPSPSPGDLISWDSATLYIDTDGNTGGAPDVYSYRFDAQLAWWEERTPYQAAYQGNGSGWSAAAVRFVTWAWGETAEGGALNNNQVDDRGWTLGCAIPFSALGISEPPSPGTVWGMGLALHDRDDGDAPPLADQVWPPSLAPQQPATWGQLFFGMPTYSPPPATPGGTVTIRQGLNGAAVPDAHVGGSSNCGEAALPDYFATWGDLNYASEIFLNIQNQQNLSDWPCFSKYYVTFPLDALPAGATVLSATLVLHQFGNAGQGWDPGPQPSLIQVLTVGEGWDESTLTWNDAPLALENVAAAWVDPLSDPPPPAGVSREWDVSRAVAEAYAAGQPVRLALYEADSALHSGKYFRTSDIDRYEQTDRPTLRITWGHPLGWIEKTATPRSGDQGDPITYTLSFLGTGQPLALTDTLPLGISAPGSFSLEGTGQEPEYDVAHHRLTWSDTPPAGQYVAIQYSVNITASTPQALVNVAELGETGGGVSTATVIVLANPYTLFLPLIQRGTLLVSVGR